MNGQWYVGRDRCSSKKEAEQSAAENAWQSLVDRTTRSNSTPSPPPVLTQRRPLLTSRVKREAIDHFPKKYADIEQFIMNKVERLGGQIQTIWTPDVRGRYKVDITGSYRYCDNVKSNHKKYQIYFLVNPVKKIYYQKCYGRKCFGFRSSMKNIIDEQDLDVKEENTIIEKPRKNEKPKKSKSSRKNTCKD